MYQLSVLVLRVLNICRAHRLEHQVQHMKPTSMDQKESFPVKREKSKQLQFVYNAHSSSSFSDYFLWACVRVPECEFALECICHLATAQLNARCCRRER